MYATREEICQFMGDMDMSMLIINSGGVCQCTSPVGRKTGPRSAQCMGCGEPLDVLAAEYQGISYLTEEDYEYRTQWYD